MSRIDRHISKKRLLPLQHFIYLQLIAEAGAMK